MNKYCFCYLVVGGGASGRSYNAGGGGEVVCGFAKTSGCCFCVVVGSGGVCQDYACYQSNNGGVSKICGLVTALPGLQGQGVSGSGYHRGRQTSVCGGPGAGGAGGHGEAKTTTSMTGCAGGIGLYGYGGGGGGSTAPAPFGGISGGCGVDGGGCGLPNCNGNNTCATGYGGGAGGGGRCGYQGVVDICYPIDGSYGITSATGGNCCYECDGYCVHRFTSNGTLCVN